ncbi:MAG: GNAT family N-acetyltransferase [Saprospiraceae bacterium]
MIQLIEPTIDLEAAYRNLLEEWQATGEPLVPWFLDINCIDFQEFIKKLQDMHSGVNLPEGFVPDSAYWLVNEHDKILGAVSIRHHLNDKLLLLGGHIGFGIRPSERQKGYASILLQLALEKCKILSLNRVLLTCSKNNIASAKVIVKNGGKLENEYVTPERITQRYWITLNTDQPKNKVNRSPH